MLASVRFLPPVPDRQTLRVCSEIVRAPFDHASHTACRLAKRHVCACSAFLDAGSCRDSSIRTRQRPPNVTRALLLVFRIDFTKRYTRNGFRACCLAICTCLDLSVRQTCVGVRFGDRAFLRLALKSYAVSRTICTRTLKRLLGIYWKPNVRTRNVCTRLCFRA